MRNFIFISPHFPDSYWKWCLALKNKGFNVLGIGDAPYNEIPEECKYSLTEYYCCWNMDDYENEKRAVQYFKDKYGEIDYLESLNEYWLEKDAMLRQDFDVKHGIRFDEIKKYKLKSQEKEYFIKAGAKVADWIVVNSVEDKDKVLEFAKKVGYPIFAKPNNGVGSQHTFKINKEEEVDNFFEKKEKVDYIVEEYIHGTIVSYDGISNSKGDVLFADSEVFSPSIAAVAEGNLDEYYYCLPCVPDDLKELGARVVKEFNVQNRFFHIEFFRTLEDSEKFGPKGSLVALEANMRAPGGYTPDLINFANSVSVYDIFADSCAFDENRVDLTKQKFYAIVSSRRFRFNYVHSEEEILAKYRNNICMYGVYPVVLRDDLGDLYYFAKFLTYDEIKEFDDFVRAKND